MDFESEYTPEQEAFRTEVREWLRDNLPDDLVEPADPADLSYEQYQKRRTLGRKLGEKGWLWPTAPTEYGGGGLAMDYAIVLEEGLDELGLALPPYYDTGGKLGGATILVWGTEEQKEHFLPPIFKGLVRSWQLLSEPDAGSDLANVKTTAIRDGEAYAINGQKVFVGSAHGADQLWMLAVTDPDAPRHENLSWFMVPADLEGITVAPMDLLISRGRRRSRVRDQEHRLLRQRPRPRLQPNRRRKPGLEGGGHPPRVGARHWRSGSPELAGRTPLRLLQERPTGRRTPDRGPRRAGPAGGHPYRRRDRSAVRTAQLLAEAFGETRLIRRSPAIPPS